jgi:tetratricopeptide (TPR) repeat protein
VTIASLLSALLLLSPLSALSPAAPETRVQEPELPTWIEQGRALLDAGKPAEAEALFARATAADGGSLATRLWVLRAWMDQGRSDETLAALDALEHSGERGIEMTYLYGMAFARRAEGAVASGTTDASTGMLFADASALLAQALEADAARFVDATVPLARAAWHSQDLETARKAADQAVAARPEWRAAWLQRGHVALSQFVVAEREQAGGERAEALWADATDSLRRARAQFEADANGPGTAESATALAHTLLWRRRAAEATEAFATAIAWAPETLDFAGMQAMLGAFRPTGEEERPLGFRAALEAGRERFAARVGEQDGRLATLDWWLGWARFSDADWAGAEAAYESCRTRAPKLTSTWFYLGLARAYRKDSEGALAALRSGWEADAEAMSATLAASGGSLRGFEGLIGWCAQQEPARNLDAAFLADGLAQAFPGEPRHWNNLGLFLRDEGERLEIDAHRKKEPPPDAARLAGLYERSFAAYERALELTPDDPQVLNDTALMLQYHLGRDLARAEAMYRHSLALSELRLAEPDLSADDRARFEQTKSDASGNLRLLLEAAPAEAGPGGGAPGTTSVRG